MQVFVFGVLVSMWLSIVIAIDERHSFARSSNFSDEMYGKTHQGCRWVRVSCLFPGFGNHSFLRWINSVIAFAIVF